MTMLLPPVISTLEATRTKNETRLDNVFGSEALTHFLLQCKVLPHHHPVYTNHYPIYTTIEVSIDKAQVNKRYNYAKAN